MRVKEAEPAYRARQLYAAANGASLDAIDYQRAGRIRQAQAKRRDARNLRALAHQELSPMTTQTPDASPVAESLAEAHAALSPSRSPVGSTEAPRSKQPSVDVSDPVALAEAVAVLRSPAPAQGDVAGLAKEDRDWLVWRVGQMKHDARSPEGEIDQPYANRIDRILSALAAPPSPSKVDAGALVEAARYARLQLNAMVCAENEGHAVYPDPDEVADRIDAALASFTDAGRGGDAAGLAKP